MPWINNYTTKINTNTHSPLIKPNSVVYYVIVCSVGNKQQEKSDGAFGAEYWGWRRKYKGKQKGTKQKTLTFYMKIIIKLFRTDIFMCIYIGRW